MSAETTKRWVAEHQDLVRQHRVRHAQKSRGTNPMCHIAHAYAVRLQCSIKVIRTIGTLQLCLCRSDEARRILVRAVEFGYASAERANFARNHRAA